MVQFEVFSSTIHVLVKKIGVAPITFSNYRLPHSVWLKKKQKTLAEISIGIERYL